MAPAGTVWLCFIDWSSSDIFAVIGRGLYADIDQERFGNIGSAALTLFQLLTLDDWFYIYSDAVARDPSKSRVYIGSTVGFINLV